ncbi:MAG: carboxypeptidase regulatory-like domain-containing protein [Methanobrevibacter sp.]|uniref:carboxypeptidase-like regulatory domain-containing protein n=1 Tax=Methanobrevibacter sp. TaxID=66852 RepID=UPI0025F2054D|nr:carboxypeptidase-like regulatory domain-containing protein [Methanobrevibacter sp.]MBQ6098530.1 carboxypeptidase regulatory-like domain-containing protein [Methanobrevibacter sp.]
MFNKKMSLFLITLVFMLSISAVVAADTNSTDDIIASEIGEEPPSGSANSISVDGDTLTAASNINYTLASSNVETYYSGYNYDVVLKQNNDPLKNASVTLKVNGVSYTQTTDSSGKVSIPLNLNAGNYVISTSYGSVSNSTNVKVTASIKASDLTKTYKSSKGFSATFLDSKGNVLKNKNTKFIICGKTYNVKTNSKGVATIAINLKPGTYAITLVHPNGYRLSKKITVKTSVVASDVSKHYLSSKVFSATFYGTNGKLMANKYIKFIAHGKTFSVKTNSKGVASISIISKPSTFKMYSVNTQTGEKVANTVKISPTLSASSMTVFSDRTSTFKVKLYKNDKLVKNAQVYVYIKGVKKVLKTDSNGVASVNFKLAKGTYTFKSYDPYTKSSINTKITVKLASIKANDVVTREHKSSVFTATLLNQDGSLAKNTNMQITLDGKTNTVKTGSNGAASLNFKLDAGTYKVTCKDLSTGYTLTKTIEVYPSSSGKTYDKYGVSDDGLTILAIGRASASGELSKYGYTFYATEFNRTCSYCGSHELYWSIFFAGSETANWGTFPATGNGEGSSAEGIIVCAKCDSDWSVFGHNHGGSGGDLTVVTPTHSCSKSDAYDLKSGDYVAA